MGRVGMGRVLDSTREGTLDACDCVYRMRVRSCTSSPGPWSS